MPIPLVCLAAKGIIRDAETNTISVFSILERLSSVGFPFFVQELGVLAVWRRAPDDPQVTEAVFRGRNNDTLAMPDVPVTINFGNQPLLRSIVAVQGLVLREPGALRLGFYTPQGAAPAEYTIDVAAPAAQAQAVPATG